MWLHQHQRYVHVDQQDNAYHACSYYMYLFQCHLWHLNSSYIDACWLIDLYITEIWAIKSKVKSQKFETKYFSWPSIVLSDSFWLEDRCDSQTMVLLNDLYIYLQHMSGQLWGVAHSHTICTVQYQRWTKWWGKQMTNNARTWKRSTSILDMT